ncbi:MAG: hypothetical protein MR281_05460 [Eubacterium sp.]|nr:hypothetical protein [Eubacterium sp.]
MAECEKLVVKMLNLATKYVQLVEKQINSSGSDEGNKMMSDNAKTIYCFISSVRTLTKIDEEIFIKYDFVQSKIERIVKEYEDYATQFIDDTLRKHSVQKDDIIEINKTMYYLQSALSSLSKINSMKAKNQMSLE